LRRRWRPEGPDAEREREVERERRVPDRRPGDVGEQGLELGLSAKLKRPIRTIPAHSPTRLDPEARKTANPIAPPR